MASFNPYIPEQDFYRRSIPEFSGVNPFFVEWRVISDGNHNVILGAAPAVINVTGFMGVHHHFTISRDLVRFIDSSPTDFFFNIGAGVSHTYRLEVDGLSFSIHIDGQLMHTGVNPRTYPGPDSLIVFGARAPNETATTRWDYIRYGKMASPAGPGDTNCDGTINAFDIQPFVVALTAPDEYGQQNPACTLSTADANGDGSVNTFDIQPFVNILTH